MKRTWPWLVSLLLAITLIAVVVVILWNQSGLFAPRDRALNQSEPLSADELLAVTSELTNIRTNIADPGYVVVIDLSFRLDSAKTREAFDKIKDVEIRPIINKALWQMSPEELSSVAGKDKLISEIINTINPVLAAIANGKLTKVEITNFIMTPI